MPTGHRSYCSVTDTSWSWPHLRGDMCSALWSMTAPHSWPGVDPAQAWCPPTQPCSPWQTQSAQSVWGCWSLHPQQAPEKTSPLPSSQDLQLSAAPEQGKLVLELAVPLRSQPPGWLQHGWTAARFCCRWVWLCEEGGGSYTHPCFSDWLRARLLMAAETGFGCW